MPTEHSKKRIFFIRHGQSHGNIQKVFQHADDPLSENGIAQASFVAHRAKAFNAEIILSSPMIRAYQTAEVIRRVTDLPLETHEHLREYLAPSSLWNMPLASVESDAFYQQMLENIHDPEWHYEDEDNYYDLYNRATSILNHLIERPERRIIAVTHGAFMRILLANMMTEGKADALTAIRMVRFLSQKNTGITNCEYNAAAESGNKWRLIAWNDHSHLESSEGIL